MTNESVLEMMSVMREQMAQMVAEQANPGAGMEAMRRERAQLDREREEILQMRRNDTEQVAMMQTNLGAGREQFWERANTIKILAKGYEATLADHSPFSAETMNAICDKPYSIFHADAQCGKSFAMGLMACKLLSMGKIPLVILNMPQKNTLKQLCDKFQRMFYNQLGFRRPVDLKLAYDIFSKGGQSDVVGQALQHPTILFASANAYDVEKLDVMLDKFPELRSKIFMITDEFHLFFTLTATEKKAEIAINKLMYGVADIDARGSLKMAIAGIAFFSATEFDLLFFLRARGVGANDFSRFTISQAKMDTMRAHGYRSVSQMDFRQLPTKYDHKSAFGKVAGCASDRFMSRKRTSDKVAKFDVAKFAAEADRSCFAPDLATFFDGWAETPKGLFIEMSTRMVDKTKTNQTVGQHAQVVSRTWPNSIAMHESGEGVSLVNERGDNVKTWSTFEDAMKHVHGDAALADRPVYLITNCGYGSRTYSDLETRRVTHMFVAFSETTANNILTKYQAVTRGNGWFAPGDVNVQILVSEDDLIALKRLERLSEEMFCKYPDIDVQSFLGELDVSIIRKYQYAHTMNESAKLCKASASRKRARIDALPGANYDHHPRDNVNEQLVPGANKHDPLAVTACTPSLPALGGVVATRLLVLEIDSADQLAELQCGMVSVRKRNQACVTVAERIKNAQKDLVPGLDCMMLRTSTGATFNTTTANPRSIKNDNHYCSYWTLMHSDGRWVVVAILRTCPKGGVSLAERVVYHAFNKALDGVLVHVV
jgi:hypothetical protein